MRQPKLVRFQEQYETLFVSMRDYAQQYMSIQSVQRTTDNSFHVSTSGQEQSLTTNRTLQRI